MSDGSSVLAVPGGDARLRELLAGIGVLRGLTLVWALAVSVVDARSQVMTHRLVAFSVLGVMALWTSATVVLSRRSPSPLESGGLIAVDVALAALVVSMDWLVYDQSHPVSFGSAWPLGAVVASGVLRGWRIGVAAGVVVGLAGVVGPALADRLDGRVMALSGTVVLFAVAGAVSGSLAERLRVAESEAAMARAREQVARTLHDGVLQTLAVIQRRSEDRELVSLARDQERDLRSFLGAGPSTGGRWRQESAAAVDVATEIRRVAGVVERRHGVRIDVVVIEGVAAGRTVVDAVAGAAGEAMTNAAKHAQASRITVSIDADELGEALVVAVVDDGVGFDPDAPTTGSGLAGSIRGRLAEVGGRVAVRSRVGSGTEVELWAPEQAS